MKKILLIPYSFYMILLFSITLAITTIAYLFILLLVHDDRKRATALYSVNTIWFRTWGMLGGILFKLEKEENIIRDEPTIIICNHCNMLDIAASSLAVQTYTKPLIKKELLKVPLLGYLFKVTSIAVDRKSDESRKKSLETMKSYLAQGCGIFIFPEGTRNRTSEPLKDFYDGAFKIAIAAQVPIQPMVLLNIRHLQPVDSAWLQPGTVTIEYLPAIPTKGLTNNDVAALKQECYNAIQATLLAKDIAFKKV